MRHPLLLEPGKFAKYTGFVRRKKTRQKIKQMYLSLSIKALSPEHWTCHFTFLIQQISTHSIEELPVQVERKVVYIF